ncbi:MAG: GNAT family N-acetyltransferase [Anaerolineae bacterium]|nr:GNAT family N-acetyltransferase [Anaerolineae bacterium]
MAVTLREITRDNWRECVDIRVDASQTQFVASNMFSLAQSKYEPECIPLAIYDDEQMVGFVMYKSEDYGLAKTWFIERLLIGADHQKKGYGRAAMTALIERLRSQHGYNAILISFIPGNDIAQKLYSDLGFKDTGELEEGELVYRLALID